MCVSLIDESKAEGTKDVTKAVDDVANSVFQSVLSRLILDAESFYLDRSYYS